MLAGASAAENHEHSRVVCLMNMVTSDELLNDEEYEGKLCKISRSIALF
jgi:splicing factor U2AF subunit